ncbi:MAG: hypothetical protein RLY58_1448 [Pseudomonadota bacterium]|jgi:glycosyltransferase involved in cell wall biosynthesis
MQNILFVIDHLGLGGAERITVQLAHHLAIRGHQVTLAVLNGKKDRVPVPETVQYIDLHLSDDFAFGKMWRKRTLTIPEQTQLQALQARLQADLIVTGYNNGHWLGRYLHGNVWHWIHGELIEKRATFHLLSTIKEFFRRMRHRHAFRALFHDRQLIVVNQDLAEHYQALLPTANIQVIGNGVDPLALRQQLPALPIQPCWDVLFLARLVHIKQPDHALLAFARSGLTGRMAIAGDGPERERLVQQAHALGIADRVDFLGWVDHPAHTIAHSRVLVLCSRNEGFGLVIAEALMLGTPVVAYACSAGIKDQLNSVNAQAGLVTPQQIDQLAHTLAQVVHHPYDIDPKQLESLTLDHMADQFETLIHARYRHGSIS